MNMLENRVALVTGGASGMGRAMALALAGAGADVALGSLLAGASRAEGEISNLPPRDDLDATRAEVEALGVQCLAADLDVSADESCDAFCRSVDERFGRVDILAHAAGITAEAKLSEHADAAWHRVIDVNLNGTYRMVRRILPGMIERGWGRIVLIASTAASVGAPTSGAYCASKAGVVGLMRCVALEGAPHGVTCNSISPTWVNTDFGRGWMGDIAREQDGRSGEEYLTDARAANPQGRLIEPDEIGTLARYLCSDEAVGVTMQDLTVSGGSLW